jgi:hypothetical protein
MGKSYTGPAFCNECGSVRGGINMEPGRTQCGTCGGFLYRYTDDREGLLLVWDEQPRRGHVHLKL